MGANKDLFMDERERDQLSFAESLEFQERNEKVSEVKTGLNAMPELIDLEIKEFQDGNISSLDLALKFRGYSEVFKSLSEKMDEWIKENRISISHEADKYPEGIVLTDSTPGVRRQDDRRKQSESFGIELLFEQL